LEEDSVCSSDRADIRVVIISDQGELLAILPIFLYLKCDSQFFGEILWFTVQWVDANSSTGIVVTFPISWEKGFYDSLARRIDMFVNP
jgi:hypothetical protein